MSLEQVYTLGMAVGIGTITVLIAICVGLWLVFRDDQDDNGWVPLLIVWMGGFICSVFWPIALTVAAIAGVVYLVVAPIKWLVGRRAA